MDLGSWKPDIEASADPARAAHHLRLLVDSAGAGVVGALTGESRRILLALLAGSQALSALLRREPAWLELVAEPEALHHPRREEGLRREIEGWLPAALDRADDAAALDALHRFRRREQLRIALRDLGRLAPLTEIVRELSNAADAFLDGVLRVVWRQATERWGSPWHLDPEGRWQPTPFCVLGLGKLGGQELNYSSDVDLLFVYGDEGSVFRTPPKKRAATGQGMANHPFFKRLGEALVKEASGRGIDAGALRIDMRLRPEGDAGPLARSLESYENFYAAWGQTWERMMLLKARCVAGNHELGGEFLELIQTFRYPRSLGTGLLREMAEMKTRIEREVVRAGEIDRNVKLGRGGIREIEFVVQALQVLHAGTNPFLQSSQTLAALPKLATYQHLTMDAAAGLARAYPFLRDVEHRIQMDEQRQTHTLPAEPAALLRIARQMGFPNHDAFDRALTAHRSFVRQVYEHILGVPDPAPTPASHALPADFDATQEWEAILTRRGFRDPSKGLRLLREFVHGPGFVHVSRRTTELGWQLLPRLLELCPDRTPTSAGGGEGFVLSDPDRVLARLDTYVQAYGARAPLYELWTARPGVFEHMLKLFDRSEFLAELAIGTPDLVDELEAGGHLRRQKSFAQTLEDLRHGAKDKDQHLWLRRYFRTEFMRLGLRDILGWVDDRSAPDELSALAEACLQYAVDVVMRRHRLAKPPFAVIGLGKLGGRELVYGSDLDVIFVAPDRTRNLPRWQKLAGEIIDLLGARTEQGTVFELDARLRPDGEKGLLVNSLGAYESYYRERAMLWEIQALTRARAVAGDPETGAAFERLARTLTDFTQVTPIAARTPDWRARITHMRTRIEKERTPPGLDALAFKTGTGGLVDVEFLVQTLAMAHGWFEPNTLRSLEKAGDAGALRPDQAETLARHFRRLRRMESILRRWSFEGEAVLPEDPAPLYRVAVRCGYHDAPTFLEDLARSRREIREIYREVMNPGNETSAGPT